MSQVYKTKDYSIFKNMDFNRDLDEVNLSKIEFSLKRKNLLHLNPILVDQELNVFDGQHRLFLARKLDLPIYYMIVPDIHVEDIISLNVATKKWETKDYLKFYVKKGNQDYIKLKEFSEETKLNVSTSLSVLGMRAGQKHGKFHTFKDGTFKFPDNAQEIKECLNKYSLLIKEINNIYAKPKQFLECSSFIRACVLFFKDKEVDYSFVCKKWDIFCQILRPCTNIRLYLQLLYEAYNYRRKDRLIRDFSRQLKYFEC